MVLPLGVALQQPVSSLLARPALYRAIMVSALQIRLPFTITAVPAPGSVRQPLPIHFRTRFCASVSFRIAVVADYLPAGQSSFVTSQPFGPLASRCNCTLHSTPPTTTRTVAAAP